MENSNNLTWQRQTACIMLPDPYRHSVIKLLNIYYNRCIITQGPHSQILMTGGLIDVHILYPKKSQVQNLSTQKNHYFFSIPKKIP